MIKPTLRIEILTKTLYLDNTILTKDKKFTYLSADATSGGSTLTVQSIVGFGVNQILCIGEIGEEQSEVIKTHATTAPSGTTITLASNLVFNHSQDTKVYLVDYDQAEFSNATTTTGTKTVIGSAITLQVDGKETQLTDSTNTTGYGFVRFQNTVPVPDTYSAYSDPVPYTGYADNTVFMIKKRALESCNEKIDGERITHEWLNETLWELRREYHNSPGKRPFRRIYNADLGNVTTGMYKIAVPADLEAPYSAKNVYGIRIGTGDNLTYYDKKDWDEDYQDIAHTTLASDYAIVDATITLTDSRDFDESGSIEIEGDDIEYSANNESTGVLTISTAGSSAHTKGKDVWQNASLGTPAYFTVFTDADGSNYIFFDCPIHSDYLDQNIWGDYYKTVTAYDSDADTLDELEYDMFVPGLTWRIKKKKNEGIVQVSPNFSTIDNDYLLWATKKANALANEYLGAEVKFVPDISHLP